MIAAKRDIRDYFSPSSVAKRKREKTLESGQSNAETPEVGSKSKTEDVPKESSSGNKRIKTVTMPILNGTEEDLFPVSLTEFKEYTNATDLVIEDIKNARKHSYEQYISNKEYVERCLHRFYTLFYAKPKYRNAHPFKSVKLLKGCPKDIEHCIFSIPEEFQRSKKHKDKNKKSKEACTNDITITSVNVEKSPKTDKSVNVKISATHNEESGDPKPGTSKSAIPGQPSPTKPTCQTVSECYPVTLKEFRKFVDTEAGYEKYLLNLCKGDVEKVEKYMQSKKHRLDYDTEIYNKFYLNPSARHKLLWKFRPCPQQVKDKILQSKCDGAVRNRVDHNSNESTKGNPATLRKPTNKVTECDNNKCLYETICDIPEQDIRLFPIKFDVFLEKTNALDIIDEDIPLKMRNNMKYLKKVAYKFYIAFYTKPELRKSEPLKLLQCPHNLRKQIFQIPEKYQRIQMPTDKTDDGKYKNDEIDSQTSKKSQISTETEKNLAILELEKDRVQKQSDDCIRAKAFNVDTSLPPNENHNLFILFKKYINCDEIIDEIFKEAAKNNSEKFEIMKSNPDLRAKALENYFEAFYKVIEIRERYKFKMKPCPSSIKNMILQTPKTHCLSADKIVDGGNSMQQRKRLIGELDKNSEEMPQLKKQRTMEPAIKAISPKANVIETGLCIGEVQQKIKKSNTSAFENVQSSSANLKNGNIKSKFSENLSDNFLKKYICRKAVNCNPEDINTALLQKIKEKILKEKSSTNPPKKNVHIQSVEVIKSPEKRLSLVYAAYLSEGLKQRILFSILQMSFDEFRKYTRIHNEEHFKDDEDLVKLYSTAITKDKMWHQNLYMSLIDLQEYLPCKGIVTHNIDLKDISPIILCCKEIVSITNFDDIVRLDYYKETAKKITDVGNLLTERRILFFNKCKTHNRWIWKTPELVENWKSILQHNTSANVPEITSITTDNAEHVNEVIAEDENQNKVQSIENLINNWEESTHFQDNPHESDDIETVIFPLHNYICIVKNITTGTSDQLKCITSERLFALNQKFEEIQDKETIIFPLKRKFSLSNRLDRSSNAGEDVYLVDNSDENNTKAAAVFRCEATLAMSNNENLNETEPAPNTHPFVVEKSAQDLLLLSGSDVTAENFDTVPLGQKLTDNVTRSATALNQSLDIFLPSSSESIPHTAAVTFSKDVLPSSSDSIPQNSAVTFSKDVLLSSASTEINSSPSPVDLFYDRLEKTTSKFTSTQDSEKQKQLPNLSEAKSPKHKTKRPLSPNLFPSSDGSSNSQLPGQKLLEVTTSITDCINELNGNDILEECSNFNVVQNYDVNNTDYAFVNMPNTQVQIQSLPIDEQLSVDPLSDEIEQQLDEMFGELATVEDASNDSNRNQNLVANEKTTTAQTIEENSNHSEHTNEVNTTIERNEPTAAEQLDLQPALESDKEIHRTDGSINKTPENVANMNIIHSQSRPSSGIFIIDVRSLNSIESSCSQNAQNIKDISIHNTRTNTTVGKDIKKETGLPNRLQFIMNDSNDSVSIETMDESVIELSDDEDKKETNIADGKVKQEIQFLNNLQFTINDSNSAPQISSLNTSPIIVLDDEDCNTANGAQTLIDQLMNPTEESSHSCAGISRISSIINDEETGTFFEAQKLPSSVEESESVEITNDNHVVHNPENNNIQTLQNSSTNKNLLTDDDNGDDGVDKEQSFEILGEIRNIDDNPLQSSEEILFEFNINSDEIEAIRQQLDLNSRDNIESLVDKQQQLNVNLNMRQEPQETAVNTGINADVCEAPVSDDTEIPNIESVNLVSKLRKKHQAKATKTKQTKIVKNSNIVPQLLHTFRPLEVAAVTKTYENKRKIKQQEKATTTTTTTTNESSSGCNKSGEATKSFSASQALATDCTLFNNTELLRDLEHAQNKPEEVASVNVCATSSTVSINSTTSVSSTEQCEYNA